MNQDFDVADVVEDTWGDISAAIHVAAAGLPDEAPRPRRPWISDRTVQLIHQRSQARHDGDAGREKKCTKP
eukprot:3081883-Pyramimonas_sp.AAC.1